MSYQANGVDITKIFWKIILDFYLYQLKNKTTSCLLGDSLHVSNIRVKFSVTFHKRISENALAFGKKQYNNLKNLKKTCNQKNDEIKTYEDKMINSRINYFQTSIKYDIKRFV